MNALPQPEGFAQKFLALHREAWLIAARATLAMAIKQPKLNNWPRTPTLLTRLQPAVFAYLVPSFGTNVKILMYMANIEVKMYYMASTDVKVYYVTNTEVKMYHMTSTMSRCISLPTVMSR